MAHVHAVLKLPLAIIFFINKAVACEGYPLVGMPFSGRKKVFGRDCGRDLGDTGRKESCETLSRFIWIHTLLSTLRFIFVPIFLLRPTLGAFGISVYAYPSWAQV